jgi:3' exoribonuclease, RNase T-like
MTNPHIMLDLETLDISPTSVVVSIGAVAFDLENPILGQTLYLELSNDLDSQQKRGCTISAETVVWWMQQDWAARNVFGKTSADDSSRVSTHEALELFSQFITDNGGNKARIWGNGADFDNVILGHLYSVYGMPRPWSYARNRCFRTIKNEHAGSDKFVRHGTHHHALDDAISQAKHLQEIMACGRFR